MSEKTFGNKTTHYMYSYVYKCEKNNKNARDLILWYLMLFKAIIVPIVQNNLEINNDAKCIFLQEKIV